MYHVTVFLDIAGFVRSVLLWKHFSSTLNQSSISGSGSKAFPASVIVDSFFWMPVTFWECYSFDYYLALWCCQNYEAYY